MPCKNSYISYRELQNDLTDHDNYAAEVGRSVKIADN